MYQWVGECTKNLITARTSFDSMKTVTNKELIKKAESVINPTKIGDYYCGDVGCALLTEKGNVYLGVCIDTCSGMGFCAEHSAIAAMVTAGEFKISKIVAVSRNARGVNTVIPPCGRCREFMFAISKENLHTKVLVGKDTIVGLSELLPYHNG